jgi:hypothetical protein
MSTYTLQGAVTVCAPHPPAEPAHHFSQPTFSKEKISKEKSVRRANADLWTTKRPDARLTNPFTEKSDEEFVRGNQTGGWGVTVGQASA